MITRKIPMERKEMRFLDDRTQNGSGGKDPPVPATPLNKRTPHKADYNVTNIRPWTSAASGGRKETSQRPQHIDRKNNLKNSLKDRRPRPSTTASVLRRHNRKSPPPSSATSGSNSGTNLKSPSEPAFRLQDDLAVPSSRGDVAFRMSAPEGAVQGEERRAASSRGGGPRRAGAYSRPQYFDLSAAASPARHADRPASLSADKVHPRMQHSSPMLAPTASSASGPRTTRVAVQPWSVTEVPDEEETNETPMSHVLYPGRTQPKTGFMRQNTEPRLNLPPKKRLQKQNSFPPPAIKSSSGRPKTPWKKKEVEGSSDLLHMLTNRRRKCLLTEPHVTPNGDAEGEESTSGSSSEEEPEPEVRERPRHRRISNKPQTVQEWSAGPTVNSDEYDTDLEEDFPTETETLVDATGGLFYEDQCHKKGIVPVQYLLRNMGEGNLRMRHHYLGGQGTRPLAQALKKNTVCEEIDLSDNYIEGLGAAALADTLKDNMFIVNLNVSNNFIRSEGAEKMAEMLESNTTLKTLSLQGNQLSDEDAKRIAESLKNNMSLSCMDLSHNKFGEVGGVYLAQGIASNIGLADLDLSWNCIREKGGVAIAKALAKNTALEILDLSWNGLSHVGTVALANALKSNKTLKVLDISNNRMNPEGAKVLGKALGKNMGLETLLLGLNPIGADGVEAILHGAAAHPRLKLLGIENTMDLTMVPHLTSFVKELQDSRDIMIMATTGPPQQSRINATVLAVFDRFLTENADRMEDLFNQMDKDGSGDVTLEELKYGLKDFGLRLTSKQLDTLLDELDADKSGTIEYTELMQGSALIKREKQKMDRAQAELMMYMDKAANNSTTPSSSSAKNKTEVDAK